MKDPLRGRDHAFLGVRPGKPRDVGIGLAHVDIKPDEIAAFARYEQDIALVLRLDRGFQPDIGKVSDREHVHHAPGVVGEVALRLRADRLPHLAARAVAADDIFRTHGFRGVRRDVAQGRGDGIVAPGIDRQGLELPTKVGDEPRGRPGHVFLQVLKETSLVDDHVREFGEPILDVLDAAGADDSGRIVRRWTPEHGLVDPVGFPGQALAQTKSLEHLHGAARHAVGLATLQRPLASLDDACPYAREARQLRRQQHPGWPGADDENIRGVRRPCWTILRAGRRRQDVRIAGSVTIKVELQRTLLPARRGAAWRIDQPAIADVSRFTAKASGTA